MKLYKFLLVLIVFLIVLNLVSSDLNCQIEEDGACDGGTLLLRLANDSGGYNNAHAEQFSQANYNNVLCCNSTGNTVTTACGETFLNLSAVTNAHVENPNQTNYATAACINIDATFSCDFEADGCTGAQSCMLSVASSEGTDNHTNNHVSECGEYTAETCCTVNSPPANVTLFSPDNGNLTAFNRTMTFGWYNSTDSENNAITYQLQVDEVSSEFQSPVIDMSSLPEGTNITYNLSSYVLDVDVNYTWRVRAYDGQDYSRWSENWTFQIPSTVIISIYDENVSFGSMAVGELNSTSDYSPYPMRVRNDGNVLTDLNVTVENNNDWLWEAYKEPSNFFRYRIDNATSYTSSQAWAAENGSFNWSHTQTDFAQLPLTNTSANIRQLNYTDSVDEAEIHIDINVPALEPPGDKGSTLRITGFVAL